MKTVRYCQNISGVILAGGRSTRMRGNDKGLMPFEGVPLYQHVLRRLQPQVAAVYLSANQHISEYQKSRLPVLTDTQPHFQGPLAGILVALRTIETEWAVFAPCDTPLIPLDFVWQLWQQKSQAPVVWVRTETREHPTLSLFHHSMAHSVARFLQQGNRKLQLFLQHSAGHAVLLNDNEDAFININTPDDLSQLQENR